MIVIVAGLVFAGGRKSAKRYRPGRPYEYAPVWFTSVPVTEEHAPGTHAALVAAPGKALAAAAAAGAAPSAPGVTGGASDRW